MGIEKERKRRDFYERAANKFKNKEMKDLFMRLRDWESTHVGKIMEIKEKITDSDLVEFVPGELKAYFKAIVDQRLQHQISPELFAREVKTENEAIDFAISFEKDAVLFFSELSRYVKGKHKETVDTLVGEEKKHILYLNELQSKLNQ